MWRHFELCIEVNSIQILYRCENYAIFSSMWSLRVIYRRESYAYCLTKLIPCILLNNMKIMRIEYRFDIYENCVSMWKFWNFYRYENYGKVIDVTTMRNMYRCVIYVNLLSIGKLHEFFVWILCELFFDVDWTWIVYRKLFREGLSMWNHG